MKHRLTSLYFALAILLVPVVAFAAEDEESEFLEARLEGYGQTVRLEGGSTALLWMLFIFLSVIVLSVLLKNPKRTHLD